jgi:hypothetical protein
MGMRVQANKITTLVLPILDLDAAAEKLAKKQGSVVWERARADFKKHYYWQVFDMLKSLGIHNVQITTPDALGDEGGSVDTSRTTKTP